MVINCPINNLSFGQVSVNILKALWLKGINPSIMPIGEVDFSAYDLTEGFIEWFKEGLAKRYELSGPTLKIWHLNGSEAVLPDQFLLTFHETDQTTEAERKIISLQKGVFVASEYTRDVFGTGELVKLGIDMDLKKEESRSDTIQWTLIGKIERRKNTLQIIKTWLELYGGDKKHQLNLLVNNPFLGERMNKSLLDSVFGEQVPFNVNVLPTLPKNSQVHSLYNHTDIDLGGLSFGEGLNLPSLSMNFLGKTSVVFNAHAHKSWANKHNAILVEPVGKAPVYDSVFFKEGGDFNQGNFSIYDFESMKGAMEMAKSSRKIGKVDGWDYLSGVDNILSSMSV